MSGPDAPTDLAIPRHLLERHFAGDPRMIAAMEEQSRAVASNIEKVGETEALKDATVVVLSANGDFTNERVLDVGEGIDIEITDDKVILKVRDVAFVDGARVVLSSPEDAVLNMPPDGSTLVAEEDPRFDVSTVHNFANDAAAAAGGVGVGKIYRNGSVLMIRVV